MHNVNVSVNSTISVLTSTSTGPAEISHNMIQKPALRKGNKVNFSQSKLRTLRNFKEVLRVFD